MSTDNRGVYRKFYVHRTDGHSAPGKKHERCAYFVLDLDHDEFSVPALQAYADACRATHPELAADIEKSLLLGAPSLLFNRRMGTERP